MEKRGIRFLVPNKYNNFISRVLNPIDIEKYNWNIDSDEVYLVKDNNMLVDRLFNDPSVKLFILPGKEFKKVIQHNMYYTIFGEFKAFPKDIEPLEIGTYEEFLSSKCEIVLLIADSCYYDIYCKDKKLIDILFKNAQKNDFKSLEYIDETDARTRLYVW